MNFYAVLKKSKTPPDECVLIKDGFCWGNFLFGIFWALYKKVWDLALIHLLIGSMAATATKFYPMFNFHIQILIVAIQVIISFYATTFIKWKLSNAGYKEVDLIAGRTEEEALLIFLRERCS